MNLLSLCFNGYTEPTPPPVARSYITFSSDAEFSISTTKHWDNKIEYSLDNGSTWRTWDGSSITSTNNTILFCGTGNTQVTAESYAATAPWTLSGTNISCSGNIETLLDYATVTNGGHPTPGDYAFGGMFQGQSELISAPVLGCPTLSKAIYFCMFTACTKLTATPALPATTMTESCYETMFAYCTFSACPTLPATTLAKGCYAYMFEGCTNVTTGPTLGAEVLAENCYRGMFGYTGLTAPPTISATTLAKNCFLSMFSNCASMSSAPSLPYTNLAEGCYSSMFNRCTSLTEPPELPATTVPKDAYNSMFMYCGGLTEAPDLPATTLGENCYQYMFYCCTSLTEPPTLPALNVPAYGYERMFFGCSGLLEAPELPATTIGNNCYAMMFYECSNITNIPELPATTLADYCYQYMFYGCSSIRLSATITDWYSKAYRIPAQGTGTAASNWSDDMFARTGGTFTGTPTVNTTYYTQKPLAVVFSSPNSFTLANTEKSWDGTMYYYNKTTSSWLIWGEAATISSDSDNKIYIRGSGNSYVSHGADRTTRVVSWVLTGSDISASGDIETLLDYQTIINGSHPTMGERAFMGAFRNATALTSVKDLEFPVEITGAYAYNIMFSGCTSLAEGPSTLPSTTVVEGSYNGMFMGCTALTEAPVMSATVVETAGCSVMFQNCSSLTEAPALNAMTLGAMAYSTMFKGCTSLAKAPSLPATSLDGINSCYSGMFQGCTSLTQVPLLRALTLSKTAYRSMYQSCTALKFSETQTEECPNAYRIPAEGTGTGESNWSQYIFRDTSGTFTGDAVINTTYYTNATIVE